MAIDQFATLCLILAVLQALSANFWGKLHPWLGMVELAFPFWGTLALIFMCVHDGSSPTFTYLGQLSFFEPLFVLVAMVVCGTKFVLHLAERIIEVIAHRLPLRPPMALFVTVMTIGPLSGSLITEPAAMTVSALLLRKRFFSAKLSGRFMYAILGLLFVNVSIGGTLTNFAAPPVLMVARIWHWDAFYMRTHFAVPVLVAIAMSTTLVAIWFNREISRLPISFDRAKRGVGGEPSLRHTLEMAGLVSLFLFGLTVLGPFQVWWLKPILTKLSGGAFFLSAMTMTSFLDNAALTYLGAQVPELPSLDRYLLVAGSVAGGGLSIIANAPNPVGYSILNSGFRRQADGKGIGPLHLVLGALVPTLVSAACLYYLG